MIRRIFRAQARRGVHLPRPRPKTEREEAANTRKKKNEKREGIYIHGKKKRKQRHSPKEIGMKNDNQWGGISARKQKEQKLSPGSSIPPPSAPALPEGNEGGVVELLFVYPLDRRGGKTQPSLAVIAPPVSTLLLTATTKSQHYRNSKIFVLHYLIMGTILGRGLTRLFSIYLRTGHEPLIKYKHTEVSP